MSGEQTFERLAVTGPGTLDQLKGGLDLNRAFQRTSIAGSFVWGHDSGSDG
jgi:hypothetical protein